MKSKKFKENLLKKHSGLYLALRVLSRAGKKDDQYIQKLLNIDNNPDLIEIVHNGTCDYGNTVYVIKENSGIDGLCVTMRFLICQLIYAVQHGFLPKIIMTQDFLYYDQDKSGEISNPFEYYFVQTNSDISVDNALNVCYGNYSHIQQIREKYRLNAYDIEDYYDEGIIDICAPVVKKYLQIKPEITGASRQFLETVSGQKGKILGVHYRGTDYKNGYSKHPVIVDENQIIDEIQKAVSAYGYETVFLATDDSKACSSIEEAVKDYAATMGIELKLFYYTDVYRGNGDSSVAFSEDSRRYHHYLLGYEVLRDMYTLSLCDSLIAGKSSVSFLSNIYKRSRNEKYDFMKILDNGNYSGDKTFW